MLALVVLMGFAQEPVTVVRCSVTGDAHSRVYELQRLGDGNDTRWALGMRSREVGESGVILPLPDAKPVVTDRQLTLDYKTQNGGRNVRWKVEPEAATLDVYTNFELEVNVDANLDPRVELMNTEGSISTLTCAINPTP